MNRHGGTSKRARTSRSALLVFAFASSLLACGGRVDPGDDGEASETGGTTGAGSGTDNPGSNSTGGSSKPGSLFDVTELGPCHPGFDPRVEPTRACDWIAKGLCYDTKLAACACVCPVNRQDSVCSSGFENGPNGKTLVTCY